MGHNYSALQCRSTWDTTPVLGSAGVHGTQLQCRSTLDTTPVHFSAGVHETKL
jgi:hypothetical protein